MSDTKIEEYKVEEYRVLLEGGEGEIVEKKSRFIATVRKCETEAEAVAFIEEMKKKYWDARHNCSAFVIGPRGNSPAAVMTESRAERRADRCWRSFWEKRFVISPWW